MCVCVCVCVRACVYLTRRMLDVEFADDAALFAPTLAAVQLALETFHRISSAFGLTINFSKTKFVSCGTAADVYEPLVIAGEEVEHVSSFVYLGSLVDPNSRAGLEVDRRLASASRAFGALRCVFNTPGLS